MSSPYAVQNSNPDPKNFQLIKAESVKNNLVVMIKYPDAKNYEGIKILLYKDVKNFNQLVLLNNGKIDPHFSDSTKSPIARFEPTKLGWDLAIQLASNI